MLTLRMRLAYINSEAAKEAIPRVTALMAEQLKWSKAEKARQEKQAREYIGSFGGPISNKKGAKLKSATMTDLYDIFELLDEDKNGYIDALELERAAVMLGFPFKSKEEVSKSFKDIDVNNNGRISSAEFTEWWNKTHSSAAFHRKLHAQLSLTAENEVAIDKLLMDDEEKRKKMD
uniref:EF-hand domain-containing protein n=1 Tax=Calcidiscus leptoporus TaxID=127549 RepID=A0A7S0JDZ3_9EUKA|mmetsp:Transcript_5321/g.12270  ORF Transcript_5321/g.12270 Transcript_5321/m.12270 type:complete len:176 (+) Transcript_5321:1-528(+)